MYVMQPRFPAARCTHSNRGNLVDGDQACAIANVPGGNRHIPKHGHWRITPNARPKCHRTGTRAAGPMWAATLPHANLDTPNASLRMRVRAAVAAGLIAAQDAPSWAQP